jgi:DNA-binding FadR family transcriptional regulator
MTETCSTPTVRCAIYTRSATDSKASLADQEESRRAALQSQLCRRNFSDARYFRTVASCTKNPIATLARVLTHDARQRASTKTNQKGQAMKSPIRSRPPLELRSFANRPQPWPPR